MSMWTTLPILANDNLTPHEITIFLLGLGVMLALARGLGEMARRFRQPTVLGELVAGILLGPTVFGYLSPDTFNALYPTTGPTAIALEGLVVLSVAMLLLVAGLEVDLSTVWRQGRAAVLVSLLGVALPFVMGAGVSTLTPRWLGYGGEHPLLAFALFAGISMSITALPVIARILMDLDMFKSDIGMLIMSAAMMNDLVGWLLFAIVLALINPGVGLEAAQAAQTAASGSGGVLWTIGLTLGFILLMLTVVRLLLHRLLPYIQAHWSWPGGVLGFVLVTALFCAAFTEHIGVHSILGAFVAGVCLGDSHHLRQRTRDTIHQFITNIFAPIFFASIGLHVNFLESFHLGMVLLVFVIACSGKIGGCFLGARLGGLGKREALGIGCGMAAQGAMGIILGQLARTAGLITDQLFVAIVIMALTTSLMSGPLLQRLLQRQRRRSFTDLLTDSHIVVRLQAATAREAISELAQRAAKVTGLTTHRIGGAVWQREMMMRTGLENGLAVPHARLIELKEPWIFLGISEHGVDFDSPDGQPARIICVLLTPEQDQTAQLELLALFARIFSQEGTRLRVRRSANSTEVLAALALAEKEEQHEAIVPHDDATLGV